ncbi:hypothetical protein SH580_17740 [Coraliomargarita algicola]|uniref:RedB protein n=1 Tax=Coraliomargarita algicola TaxID=3092156 RepID=A0ABZ0RGV5_9BACT|nr:hypothetical protein [Coraliomargarita sp. J2-16]WPJ95267.1 hypothetical protein SH580_17740 [Coraliomargarita sp. J2-16]
MLGLIWLFLVGIGIAWLWVYSQTPGGFGEVPDVWPESSSLELNGSHFQLLMFVHPQCPCSRSSLGELAVLMRHCSSDLSARVLFVSLAGQSSEWTHSGLWHQAEGIPNVTVGLDRDGVEAACFGAETSGATLVYAGSGQLLFRGGITASRGHYGDNVGRLAIQQLVNGRDAERQTAVFGCLLNDMQCELHSEHAM